LTVGLYLVDLQFWNFMDGQLLLSQAAELDRPPTQLEIEAELRTPGKSGRPQSSSSKGGVSNPRDLVALRNTMDTRIDGLASEVEDVKITLKQLLLEVRRIRPPNTPQESSEVGNTRLEEVHPAAAEPPAVAVVPEDPVWGRVKTATNTEEEVHVTIQQVAEAAVEV
jgi:hypothetical protein